MAMLPPAVLSNLETFPQFPGHTVDEVLQHRPRVVRATRNADGCSVVVKAIPIDRYREDEVLLTRLGHGQPAAAVVPVQEIDRDNHFVYLESPFFQNGDLFNFIRERGAIPEDQALKMVLPVVDVLASMHKLGAVHLDVKPANIFLDGTSLKLADFGAARFVDNGVELASAAGTMGFIAPELVGEQHWASPAADVYSIGMTLYIMLLGSPMTHPHKTPLGTCLRQSDALNRGEVNFGNVSTDLVSLLYEALAFDPKERPSMRKLRSRILALGLQNQLRNNPVVVAAVDGVQRISLPVAAKTAA
eukprot:INCI17498.1.p1 GENE.INCI17498.1~~INCI17498.1.p1  ORF type:complete len:355 (+),score=47.36 INCI17498.1:159-1067(+)